MSRFVPLTQPTIFIAFPRDMAPEAAIVAEVVDEIRQTFPAHHRLGVYRAKEADHGWRADATYQEQIPSPGDPLVIAVVCLFGERLGEPLPNDFPLPLDCPLPPEVEFPWRGGSADSIPLTGTVFEYLYTRARNEQPSIANTAIPLLLYVRGDAARITSGESADRRQFGYRRHYSELVKEGLKSDLDEHWHQVGLLAKFLDRVHKPGERGCNFIGEDEGEFRRQVRDHLVHLLALPDVPEAPVGALKGLAAYDVEDQAIFAGRDRAIDTVFREMRRLEDGGQGAWAGLVIGASGVGKSSLLRAGIAAEVRAGARDRLDRSYRAAVVTPAALCVSDAIANLGAVLADPKALPELGNAQLLRERLARDRDAAPTILLSLIEEVCTAKASATAPSRDAPLPRATRLILLIDQLDELIGPVVDPSFDTERHRLIDFVLEAAKGRVFWTVATLADARLSAWNRFAKSDASTFYHWPLGNPDWDSIGEIVECSFRMLRLPLDMRIKARLIDSCRTLSRDGTVTLPLLSVAMVRVTDALRETCARLLPNEPGGALRYAQLKLPEEVVHQLLALADIRSAIDDLAEGAWRSALSHPRLAGATQPPEVGRLMRRLVSLDPSTGNDDIVLSTCSLGDASWSTLQPLTDALRKSRVLVDADEHRVRLIHEAVVRHWGRAQQWLEKTQRALRFLEMIRPLSEHWGAAPDGRKQNMLLPPGYCGDAQRVLLEWQGDYDGVPVEFIRSSLALHAADIVNEVTEDGWWPLGIAARIGDSALTQAYLDAGASVVLGGPNDLTPLHSAASRDVAQCLLARLADVNATSTDGATPLISAVRAGNIPVVQALIAAGATLDAGDRTNRTALVFAVDAERADVVELLVNAGASVNAPSAGWRLPLMAACLRSNTALCGYLLDHGADHRLLEMSGVDHATGKSCLVTAVEFGASGCVVALLRRCDYRDNADMGAALVLSARLGNTDVMDLLLQAGANPAARDPEGMTALHASALLARPDLFTKLRRVGADLNSMTPQGMTIVHFAALGGNTEIVREVLEQRLDINAQAANGRTPLHCACEKNHATVARMLIDAGARTDLENVGGFTPLEQAIMHHALSCIDVLLDSNVSAIAPNRRGRSAVGLALEQGDGEVLEHLRKRGVDLCSAAQRGTPLAVSAAQFLSASTDEVQPSALLSILGHELGDVDASDGRGMTALMYACWWSQERLVEDLLRRGADPNRRGPNDWTPLMFAVAKTEGADDEDEEIIRHLIAHGARLDARNDDGRTASEVAAQFHGSSVCERLELIRRGIVPGLPANAASSPSSG